ncbi:MAG: glycosyltransferase family 39 protein [Acidobacteriota bacterium]
MRLQQILTRRRLRYLSPALAVLALWAYAWPSLRLVNPTWDEGLGDLFFGQRYFSYFTTFDPIYLDFAADPYPEGHRPDLSASPFRVKPWEYYPFANTLAAATSSVLFSIGLTDPLDGFHALNLLLAGLLIPSLFFAVEKRLGMLAAALTVIFLFSSPRIIAHLLANIKDFPLMCFFAWTSLAFFKAFERGSVRGMLGAGLCLGLTLATKANALFFPLLPLLMMLIVGIPSQWKWRRLSVAGVGAATTTVGVTLAVWPYLWADPIGRFGRHFEYIATRKSDIDSQFEAPIFEAIFLTTPPLFLAAFLVGCWPLLSKLRRRDSFAAFLAAWLITPIARYALPQSTNFDGVRHFLELFPPMAIVAGWGAAFAIHGLIKRLPLGSLRPEPVKVALALTLVLPGISAVLAHHPFHLTYWNVFAGGFAGAYASNQPQVGDYWGASYRFGLEWLHENAEENAYVAVPVIEHAVRTVAPERLRSDLTLLPITSPFKPDIDPERLQKTIEAARSRPLYVMFVERRDWLNALMVDCLRRLEPVAMWDQDGVPVLYIYRYEPLPKARAVTHAVGEGEANARGPARPGG